MHWHGLFLPSQIDGAMEEGTPMIPPGGNARYTFTPRPCRLALVPHAYLRRQRSAAGASTAASIGFLLIDARDNPGRYDQEIFLALHDWAASCWPATMVP